MTDLPPDLPPDLPSGLPAVMPRKRDDALVADFETELVVLVPQSRTAHLLDEGLSLLLESCDGTTPTADVIAEVAEATGDAPEQVAVWLANSLRTLIDLGIVDADGNEHGEEGI